MSLSSQRPITLLFLLLGRCPLGPPPSPPSSPSAAQSLLKPFSRGGSVDDHARGPSTSSPRSSPSPPLCSPRAATYTLPSGPLAQHTNALDAGPVQVEDHPITGLHHWCEVIVLTARHGVPSKPPLSPKFGIRTACATSYCTPPLLASPSRRGDLCARLPLYLMRQSTTKSTCIHPDSALDPAHPLGLDRLEQANVVDPMILLALDLHLRFLKLVCTTRCVLKSGDSSCEFAVMWLFCDSKVLCWCVLLGHPCKVCPGQVPWLTKLFLWSVEFGCTPPSASPRRST